MRINFFCLGAVVVMQITATWAQAPAAAPDNEVASMAKPTPNPFTGRYFSTEAMERDRQTAVVQAQIASSRAATAQSEVQEAESRARLRSVLSGALDKAISTTTTKVVGAINAAIIPPKTPLSRTVVGTRNKRSVGGQRIASAAPDSALPQIASVPTLPPQLPTFEIGQIGFADGRVLSLKERSGSVGVSERSGLPYVINKPALLFVDTRLPVAALAEASRSGAQAVARAPDVAPNALSLDASLIKSPLGAPSVQ